jgi:hypothetical protein
MIVVIAAAPVNGNQEVYIVLGIDENENDQVIAVFYSYTHAKRFCLKMGTETEYYDLWIEKHPIM